jgi:hypothetical protein
VREARCPSLLRSVGQGKSKSQAGRRPLSGRSPSRTSSRCPGAPHRCPRSLSRCPGTPHRCPRSPSRCPGAPHRCPRSLSRCPGAPCRCPRSLSRCPGDTAPVSAVPESMSRGTVPVSAVPESMSEVPGTASREAAGPRGLLVVAAGLCRLRPDAHDLHPRPQSRRQRSSQPRGRAVTLQGARGACRRRPWPRPAVAWPSLRVTEKPLHDALVPWTAGRWPSRFGRATRLCTYWKTPLRQSTNAQVKHGGHSPCP